MCLLKPVGSQITLPNRKRGSEGRIGWIFKEGCHRLNPVQWFHIVRIEETYEVLYICIRLVVSIHIMYMEVRWNLILPQLNLVSSRFSIELQGAVGQN